MESFCDGPLSVVLPLCMRKCVCPTVNNIMKQLLLLNRSLDFDQTSQDWPQGGPVPMLFKPFQLVASVGHGVKNRSSKCIFQIYFCPKLQGAKLLYLAIFGIYNHLEALNQGCLQKCPCVKIDATPGLDFLHRIV